MIAVRTRARPLGLDAESPLPLTLGQSPPLGQRGGGAVWEGLRLGGWGGGGFCEGPLFWWGGYTQIMYIAPRFALVAPIAKRMTFFREGPQGALTAYCILQGPQGKGN